jgi:hypothetical protein
VSESLKTGPASVGLYRFGTLPGFTNLAALGALPIKNYTTNVYESEQALQQFAPETSAEPSHTAVTSAPPVACTTA